MLAQIADKYLLDAMHRLKNDVDMQLFVKYLEEQKYHIADQACKTAGLASDELSGAYKLMEELLGLLSLEEYKGPSMQVDNRFA